MYLILIFRCCRVRTLKRVPQPINLQMIDDFRCVVLCKRELRTYDLNRGHLITILKGDFFAIFVKDKRYSYILKSINIRTLLNFNLLISDRSLSYDINLKFACTVIYLILFMNKD